MQTTTLISDKLESYFDQGNSLLSCLTPLLEKLSWQGNQRELVEELPHFSHFLTITQFNRVMKVLGFSTQRIKISEDETLPLPCLVIDNEHSMVVLEKNSGGYYIYDGSEKKYVTKADIHGQIYIYSPQANNNPDESLIKKQLKEIGFPFTAFFLTSLLLSLLGLSIPFFVMAVYNRVLSSGSFSLLVTLVVGIGIAISSNYFLQLSQRKFIVAFTQHLSDRIGESVFFHLIQLHLAKIEGASIGAQINKLKEFDAIKELLLSPSLPAIINLPFVFVSLIAIVALAGSVVWVPIIAIVLLSGVVWVTKPILGRSQLSARQQTLQRQLFILESLECHEDIELNNTTKIWQQRFRQLSASTSMIQYRSSVLQAMMITTSESVVSITILLTVVLGVSQAIHGYLSIGGLIALMMIVTRALSPIKTIEQHLPKYIQAIASIKQINTLMKIQTEGSTKKIKQTHPIVYGDIEFSKVIYRYPNTTVPILLNVSFHLKHGQWLIITGKDSCGKTTLLDLIVQFYEPIAGHIYIGGREIHQMPAKALRENIAYVQQKQHIFYGTIKQNLLLSQPLATDSEIQQTLVKVGLSNAIDELPNGIHTRLDEAFILQLSPSFKQRFAIARALIKKPKLLLLDDPTQHLEHALAEHVMDTLKSLKGETTIIMVTHRPSYFPYADVIGHLSEGNLSFRKQDNEYH